MRRHAPVDGSRRSGVRGCAQVRGTRGGPHRPGGSSWPPRPGDESVIAVLALRSEPADPRL